MKRLLITAIVVCISLGFSIHAWAQHRCTATVEASASDLTFTIPCAVVGSTADGVHDSWWLQFKINSIEPFQLLGFSEPARNDAYANAASPVPKTGDAYSTGAPLAAPTRKFEAAEPGLVAATTNSRGDGDLKKGAAWPDPRFTDNANGTVTDNLTGLIWLKNADCMEFYDGDATGRNDRLWSEALNAANKLSDGYCDLQDDSSAGEWRLANVRELYSLVHFAYSDPALPDTAGTGQWTENDPFTGINSTYYWSSTTYADITTRAWSVFLVEGNVDSSDKGFSYCVWPVRGGL